MTPTRIALAVAAVVMALGGAFAGRALITAGDGRPDLGQPITVDPATVSPRPTRGSDAANPGPSTPPHSTSRGATPVPPPSACPGGTTARPDDDDCADRPTGDTDDDCDGVDLDDCDD